MLFLLLWGPSNEIMDYSILMRSATKWQNMTEVLMSDAVHEEAGGHH